MENAPAGDNPGPADPELRALNLGLMRTFSRALLPMLVTVLLLVGGVTLLVFLMIERRGGPDVWGQILAIHLVQVGAGMVLGLFCLFLGSVMCWFGVTGTFSLGVEGAGGKLNLQGAQVGLILLVGGLLLCAASLHKSLKAEAGDDASSPAPKLGDVASVLKKVDEHDQKLRSLIAAGPLAPVDDPARRAEARASLAEVQAAEASAFREAVDVATRAVKNIDDPSSRAAASQVIEALKGLAARKAGGPGPPSMFPTSP